MYPRTLALIDVVCVSVCVCVCVCVCVPLISECYDIR